MAKEEKPLEYEPRIQDTKGLAQRLNLSYLRLRNNFRDRRLKITMLAPIVACAGILPFFFKGTDKFYANGPVSRAHAVFEKDCNVCHTQAFAKVSDNSCKTCHDGPIHQANVSGEARCGACHVEHRGKIRLADMDDQNCTRCHSNLNQHGRNVQIKAVRITDFRPSRHPDFLAPSKIDQRPIKLNHAAHMPARPKTILGKKLPMKCSGCHATDVKSAKGDLLAVTFEQNCRSCHQRELEFDVYQLLGDQAPPAPHTKDPASIHAFILRRYQDLYNANPAIIQKPLGRDFQAAPNQAAWLDTVVSKSEQYLFQNKCIYCHYYEEVAGAYPVVKKVNAIRGRYVASKAQGEDWFQTQSGRGTAEFSHRAHRAVTCVSCHVKAVNSSKTEDVLIPVMQSCLPCHGSTGTSQDRCVQCHLYHDKTRELDRDRRPVEQLVGQVRP